MKPPAIALFALLSCCLCAIPGHSQGAAPVPLQAELVKQLDLKHVTPGASIRAKVTVDWAGPDCALRRGADLEGTVEAVEQRKDGHPATLALAFRRAACNGRNLVPLNLVIVALAQAPEQLDVIPAVSFGSSGGPYTGGGGVAGVGPVSDINSPRKQVATGQRRFPANAPVKTGDVLDIGGLTLSAGTGPNRSSVMTARKGDISLRQYTQMLLVPESLMFAPRPEPPQPRPDSKTKPSPATPPGR